MTVLCETLVEMQIGAFCMFSIPSLFARRSVGGTEEALSRELVAIRRAASPAHVKEDDLATRFLGGTDATAAGDVTEDVRPLKNRFR